MAAIRPTQFLSRIPFTIILVLVVAAVSWGGIANLQPFRQNLFEKIGERVGLLPWHMQRGELFRLAMSVFFARPGIELTLALVLVAVGVGTGERRVGTGKAILVFVGSHLAVLLTLTIALAFRNQRTEGMWENLLAVAFWVGPAAGYSGCLGVGCQKQPEPRRVALLSVIGGLLFARAVWAGHAYGIASVRHAPDLARLLAFGLGVGIGRRL
ncbi:MAG: hypothetical protein JSS02_19150 [Planctomycetes bacterium]|nr:hypothetical protein [Planctomycetota bacterium]